MTHQFSMLHKLERKSKSKLYCNCFWHNFAFIIHQKKSLKVLEGWESIKITKRINPRLDEIFSEGAFSQDGYYQFDAILTWNKTFIKLFILLYKGFQPIVKSYSWCDLRFVGGWSWWGDRVGLHNASWPWIRFSKWILMSVGCCWSLFEGKKTEKAHINIKAI